MSINPFKGLSINITVAGIAGVLAILIICMTALTLSDKQIPLPLLVLTGALASALGATGFTSRSGDQ